MKKGTPPIGRREVMAGATALALSAAPMAQVLAQAAPADTARGTVYDADSQPRRGIAGVMVSNGQEVVQTDADGGWSLPVRAGKSVFVIKPPGWALPVDAATNLPHFAYVYAPDGSPDLGFRFAGLAPTGKLPASIDFALHRQAEQPRFEAILFTDPQPESLAEVGYIRDDVVAIVEQRGAAFGITHGDLMFDDLSVLPALQSHRRHHRPALVQLLRQPRHEPRSA